MGTCNGVSSLCAIGGYALETRCHLGEVIRYDTVGELGWSVSLRTHVIEVVMHQVLELDWQNVTSAAEAVPERRKAADVEGEDGICTVSFRCFFCAWTLLNHLLPLGLFQLGVWELHE